MKNIFLLFVFLIGNIILFSQSPYELDLKKEIAFVGTGLSAYGVSLIIDVKPLTESQVLALDASDINAIDRGVVNNYSSKARDASDQFLKFNYFLPGLFLIPKTSRKDFFTIGVLYCESVLLTSGITLAAKDITKRARPFVYNNDIPVSEKLDKTDRYSFFSGHTSVVTASSIFAAKVFSDYYPESKWKPIVTGLAIVIPATTGYLRVKGGKHFPTDVATGFAVGGLAGFLIPHLHKKDRKKKLTIMPTGNGLYLSKLF